MYKLIIDPTNPYAKKSKKDKAILNYFFETLNEYPQIKITVDAKNSKNTLNIPKNTDIEFYYLNPETNLQEEVSIRFIYELVYREKKFANGESLKRYYVLDSKKLDDGSFGEILPVLGTLKQQPSGISFIKRNSRVIKRGIHKKLPDKAKRLLNQELTLAPQVLHLRMTVLEKKDDTDITDYAMHRFEKSLFDKVTMLFNNNEKFTKDEFLKIASNTLRTLQTQVHDLGLIHRDIKPENIMIDSAYNIDFIDYGFVREHDKPDHISCGTPDFAPPEVKNVSDDTFDTTFIGTKAYALDVYSMGKTLEELAKYSALNETSPGIINLIKKMTDEIQEKRITLAEAINELEGIKLTSHLTTLAEEDREKIKKSHQSALNAYDQLSDAAKNGDISEIKKAIEDSLNKFDSSDPASLSFYLQTLSIKNLSTCTSKDDILNKVDVTIQQFYKHAEHLMQLAAETDFMAINAEKLLQSHSSKAELRYIATEIRSALFKHRRYGVTFDEIFALNEKFKQGIEKLSKNLSPLATKFQPIKPLALMLTKLDQPKASSELEELRQAIQEALTKYMKTTLTDKNILKKDRAASNKRIATMQRIADIVYKEENSNAAKLAIKKVLQSDIGFFARFNSSLYKNVNKAISKPKPGSKK